MDSSDEEKAAPGAQEKPYDSEPSLFDEEKIAPGSQEILPTHDVERNLFENDKAVPSLQNSPEVYDSETALFNENERVNELRTRKGVFSKLRAAEEWLDSKVGIETQGIDRIREEDKRPQSQWNIFFLWFSLNMHVGTLPIGLLGPQFGLSLGQSVAANLVGTVIGAWATSYTGTLGPKLGLRQIACARYSFGFWGAKLCSVINVIVGGGFYVVNLVVVGQILSAVTDYHLTIIVGIILVAALSYIISIFGLRVIHTYEKYSWISTFILFCVIVAQAAPHVRADLPGTISGSSNTVKAGTFLTIATINYGNASGWCSIASDYLVNYPATISSRKVMALIWVGIMIPTMWTTTIGACLGNIVFTAQQPHLATVYNEHGLGGLISSVFHPVGWSKFALVILTFSVIGNNIAINYSSGLSLQLLGHHFHAVPRFVWSAAVAFVTAALAVAGRQHLSTVVSNFVSLLTYWTAPFTLVLLLEDKVFRSKRGYDLEVWDQPSKLPLGIAGVSALLAGYLAGGVTGMAQQWYVGPIARYFGPYGGDVGGFLAGAIAVVVYPTVRVIERHYTGR